MRSGVNVRAVWGAACAMAAAVPAPAAADLGGWVPSLALAGGTTFQQEEASVETFCEFGGPDDPTNDFSPPCIGHLPPAPGPLRPADSGSEWAVVPFVGVDVQLMTPTIPRIWGRPRVFVRGEVHFAFGSTHNVANEGNPDGSVHLPLDKPNRNLPTSALVGVGSRTISETQVLGWGAAAGIAFPFQFRGHQLWLRPGAAWTRYTIDVEGISQGGLKNDPETPAGPGDYGSELRVITLTDKTSKTYDGIGPSLELELDVGHFGPIGSSLFIGGGAYRILGNREVALSKSASFPLGEYGVAPEPPNQFRLPADNYTANWSYEIDPWMYRAWVGLRFSWLGK